jgi:uncharacterized protein
MSSDAWAPVPHQQVQLLPGYWTDRLRINAHDALYHQYRQLEDTGCIRNFELAGGSGEGFREGYFFADSDAYKWLEAALLSLYRFPDVQLQLLVDHFVALLEKAQCPDGYLYTYNQLHFPNTRWQNLQVEHELYCLGHLIEAGVTAMQLGVNLPLQGVARRAADLIVCEFSQGGPERTDGHEEIEIALLRLFRATGEMKYLAAARHLLQVRGTGKNYAWLAVSQMTRTVLRMQKRDRMREAYYRGHPDVRVAHLPARNAYHQPANIGLRVVHSMASGKYTQSHAPVSTQEEPVGHAVRFVYLQTARAMLAGADSTPENLLRMRRLWERMISCRMYVTGGLGALPVVEGFGRDYELPAEGAYAETCAALGSIFWNQEMGLLTGEAAFDDLLEWQLYNAASVGAGLDGCTYLYNNPIESTGEVQRVAWYDCPCCPSNLSRTWSNLPGYVFTVHPGAVRVRQYLSAEASFQLPHGVKLEMTSDLPWRGKVWIVIHCQQPARFKLELRRPSWAGDCTITINGQPVESGLFPIETTQEPTACGYDPRRAGWIELEREWHDGDSLLLDLDMQIYAYPQDVRIADYGGKSAFGCGPLIYCQETDLDCTDLLCKSILPSSLAVHFETDLLGGTNVLNGASADGQAVRLIPYFLWGNRGASKTRMFFTTRE